MTRLEQYFLTFKTIYMIWYIVSAVILFAAGFLVGSNNPLPSVKKKVIQKAQDSLNKIKNA